MNSINLGTLNGKSIKYGDSHINITSSGYEYKAYYPLELNNRSSFEDFGFEMFQRTTSVENKSMQVYINNSITNSKVRLGWIIPITALTSLEHDFFENEHFLNYAKCAFSFLLLDIIEKKSPENLDIDINEYFTEKVHIFCYYKPNFSDLNMNEIVFSLFSHGYYRFNEEDSKLAIEYSESNEILVSRISKDIRNKDYINSLIEYFIPRNDLPLFDFYYMYQIIEVLISQIFLIGKDDAIIEMMDCDSASQIRESLFAINDLLSEKNRIRKLLTEYIQLASIPFRQDLIQNINDFLNNNMDIKPCNSIEDAIYRLRNLLVHNHYKVKDFSGLETINKYFRELLTITLTQIKIDS